MSLNGLLKNELNHCSQIKTCIRTSGVSYLEFFNTESKFEGREEWMGGDDLGPPTGSPRVICGFPSKSFGGPLLGGRPPFFPFFQEAMSEELYSSQLDTMSIPFFGRRIKPEVDNEDSN